jgi:glucose-1-phosphate adenylyltransferase, GlgD subunit
MKDAMALIYTAEDDIGLKDITQRRSAAAVPIWGRYRIIDFILSNMVNSGVRNVGIITRNNYGSLMDHIGQGKEWNLTRKRGGLYILPPFVRYDYRGIGNGDADDFYNVMGYVRKSEQKYVIVSGSHMICNMTYNDMFNFHMEKGADITIVYKQYEGLPADFLKKYTLIETSEDDRVKGFEISPYIPKYNKIYMKMFIMDKLLFEYLTDECVARGNSDFTRDILMNRLDSLKIYGYRYDGYLALIDSIPAYYKHSMDLLDPNIRNELFFKSGPVYTRVKDEVPARYSDDASVKNCIVADGCVIEGEIENSIIFRGVRIFKGARIKDSIIMQNAEVQENSILEHVILDKDVIIKRGKSLIGQENYPVVIGKGSVI